MVDSEHNDQLHPLAEIDPIIHAHARLMILTYLYVVDTADYVFISRITNLTWGNLASHIKKLEEAKYIEVEKSFKGKKPHTVLRMTPIGREAFNKYRQEMKNVLDSLPE